MEDKCMVSEDRTLTALITPDNEVIFFIVACAIDRVEYPELLNHFIANKKTKTNSYGGVGYPRQIITDCDMCIQRISTI